MPYVAIKVYSFLKKLSDCEDIPILVNGKFNKRKKLVAIEVDFLNRNGVTTAKKIIDNKLSDVWTEHVFIKLYHRIDYDLTDISVLKIDD